MNSGFMDDYGNYYPAVMSGAACASYWVSASAYGGQDCRAGWGEEPV